MNENTAKYHVLYRQPHQVSLITPPHILYIFRYTWADVTLSVEPQDASWQLRTCPDGLHTGQPLVKDAENCWWPLITLVHDQWPLCLPTVCLLSAYCSTSAQGWGKTWIFNPQSVLDLFTDKSWLLHCPRKPTNCSRTDIFISKQGILLWGHSLSHRQCIFQDVKAYYIIKGCWKMHWIVTLLFQHSECKMICPDGIETIIWNWTMGCSCCKYWTGGWKKSSGFTQTGIGHAVFIPDSR